MRLASPLVAVAFLHAIAAVQVIGPVTNLTISNAFIAPDGFSRSAVLAGGTFPGSLITAQSVCCLDARVIFHGLHIQRHPADGAIQHYCTESPYRHVYGCRDLGQLAWDVSEELIVGRRSALCNSVSSSAR
jgi:hypothetical protein